jgi:hypothetical protein
VPLLPRSRRATADETLLRLNQYAPGSSSSSTSGSAAGSRALIRQLSHQQQASGAQTAQQLQWQGNRLWTADAATNSAVSAPGSSGRSSSGSGAIAAAPVLPSAGGLSALGFSRVQQASASLAVLGPGSLLGENVLGYDAEQVSSWYIAGNSRRLSWTSRCFQSMLLSVGLVCLRSQLEGPGYNTAANECHHPHMHSCDERFYMMV